MRFRSAVGHEGRTVLLAGGFVNRQMSGKSCPHELATPLSGLSMASSRLCLGCPGTGGTSDQMLVSAVITGFYSRVCKARPGKH